jgi:type I restriction enzyme, S subunit
LTSESVSGRPLAVRIQRVAERCCLVVRARCAARAEPAIAASDFRGIISPAYIVMRLRGDQLSTIFIAHLILLKKPSAGRTALRRTCGVFDLSHFKMIYSAVPPRDEQTTIVRFIDHANERIERAIRSKKKLIALLNEQKQAIIHRAVTRGLDPTVPLKPSGIPWLDD